MRAYFAAIKSGTRQSLESWRDLANLLLRVTVADSAEHIRLSWPAGGKRIAAQFGRKDEPPTLLRNGKYLRVLQSLSIEPSDEHGPRLKVLASVYQYAADATESNWLFRYDYVRVPPNKYPGAHLQICKAAPPDLPCLPAKPVERIHFPTGRVSLEAVLRLLIEDFGIEAATPEHYWRGVLRASEDEFYKIAHPPSPGPAH